MSRDLSDPSARPANWALNGRAARGLRHPRALPAGPDPPDLVAAGLREGRPNLIIDAYRKSWDFLQAVEIDGPGVYCDPADAARFAPHWYGYAW